MFPTKIFINYKEKSTVERPHSHHPNYGQTMQSRDKKQNHVSTKETVRTQNRCYEICTKDAKPETSNGEISNKPSTGNVLQNN